MVWFASPQEWECRYKPDGLVDIVLNWLDCTSRNVHPLAYFDRLGRRDFQREKETVISHLVDLTPQNLESWRFAEKGLRLLRKTTPSRRLERGVGDRTFLVIPVRHLFLVLDEYEESTAVGHKKSVSCSGV